MLNQRAKAVNPKRETAVYLLILAIVAAAAAVTLTRLYHITNDFEHDLFVSGWQLITGMALDGVQITHFNLFGLLLYMGFAAAAAGLVQQMLTLHQNTTDKRGVRTAAIALTVSSILLLLFEPVAKSAMTADGLAALESMSQKFAFNHYPASAAFWITFLCVLTSVWLLIKGFGKTAFWQAHESAVYMATIFGLLLYCWQYGYLHILFGIGINSASFPYPFDHAINSYNKLSGGIKGDYNSVFGSLWTLLQHPVNTSLDDSLFYNSGTTVFSMLIGYVLGNIIGYLVALIATSCRRWGSGVLVVCSILVSFPIVALGPIANHWFPSNSYLYSFVAKVIVVTILSMAGMTVNAYKGLTKTKPFAEDVLRLCNATPMTVFKKLRFHNSLPNVFTALKINTATALMGAFVCEFYSRSKTFGLGMWFIYYWRSARYQAWVYIFVIILYGLILYQLVAIIEKRSIHWHTSQRKA